MGSFSSFFGQVKPDSTKSIKSLDLGEMELSPGRFHATLVGIPGSAFEGRPRDGRNIEVFYYEDGKRAFTMSEVSQR